MRPSFIMKLNILATVSVTACIGEVPATNPYDSETPVEQQQETILKGTVLGDPGNGTAPMPLLGAVVDLDGPTVPANNPITTDSDGRFQFDALIPGRYTLNVGHAAFLRQVREVTLDPGEERDLEAILDAGVAAAEQAMWSLPARTSWPSRVR